MNRHKLNRMFDALTPSPEREQTLLNELLQDGAQRKSPTKHWRRIILTAATAALLATGAAAVVAPGISRRLLDFFGVAAEDGQAAELLAPGVVAADVSAKDNGMTLHVTQVLREGRSILALADFTAPNGTALNYTEEDQLRSMLSSEFPGYNTSAGLLDKDGGRIEEGPWLGGQHWRVMDDGDPTDNHLTLVFRMEFDPDSACVQKAVSLRLPSPKLYRFKGGRLEEAYPGDWSCVVPLPQADTRWVLPLGQAIGTLDEAEITVEELQLSPVTLRIALKREYPAVVEINPYGEVVDLEEEAIYARWAALGENEEGISLTDKNGRTVPVRLYTSGVYEGEQWWSYRLEEAVDPARFQGGTLTLNWACGRAAIPLNAIAPVEPQT